MLNLRVLYLILMLAAMNVSGQSNIVASGGNAAGSAGSASYSIGQIDFNTVKGTENYLVEGVQQPYEIIPLFTEAIPEIAIKVYPNPATASLNIEFVNTDTEGSSFRISDLNGRLLQEGVIDSRIKTIDVANLPAAAYILSIQKENKLLKSFKIIKR